MISRSSPSTVTNPELPLPDTVSCISWNPNPDVYQFVASSWDSSLRFYVYNDDVHSLIEKGIIPTEDPCLSVASRGALIVAGTINGSVQVIDLLSKNRPVPIGQHNDAVKDVYLSPEGQIISVSYDKTIKIWDIRCNSARTITSPYKIYCSDIDFEKKQIALGLGEEKVYVSNVDDLSLLADRELTRLTDSPLGKGSQLSAISLSKYENLVAFVTSDGKACVSKLSNMPNGPMKLGPVRSFEAHKQDPGEGGINTRLKIMHPVHAVKFHPRVMSRLITAGGDGKINYWNSSQRGLIRSVDKGTIPISKAVFSPDGKYIAYGRGYDWSSGIQGDMSFPSFTGVISEFSEEH